MSSEGVVLEAVRIRDHALGVNKLRAPDDFEVNEAPAGSEHGPGGSLSPLVDATGNEATEDDHFLIWMFFKGCFLKRKKTLVFYLKKVFSDIIRGFSKYFILRIKIF